MTPPEDAAPVRPAGSGLLARSEETFRHLVAGVQDYAIFLLDAEGHIETWNAGARSIKGYEADEIIGRHFSVFYTPDAKERRWPQRELELATREGRCEDEGWRVRKDGTQFWASVVITPLRAEDGSVRGFLKITRDLTERRLAEESLRQSEERFRLLVEGVRDYAIFALTPEGRIASWNAGAERIKGYGAEEIIGEHFSRFYTPEAIEQGKPEWHLRTAIEHGSVEDEGWRVRKDGRRFWAATVLTAVFDRDGSHRGFAKLTRDLTDRQRIGELQEADRLKNEFLALLAHELRNPLAPIRSAVHVLGRPEASAVEIARAREIAERQVQHMSRLLDDLLDVARISQGRMELRKELLDAGAIVRRAVEAEQSFIDDRGLRLTVTLPDAKLGVEADPARLQQILTNLLNNAAKYTPAGGQIRVSGEIAGAYVVLRVQDNGIGMDASFIPRLFDLFVQGERRMERSAGGVGIGLALVKRLVEMHGGTVHALSPGPGKGSEFVVRLPAVEIVPRVASPLPARESRPSGQRGLRVLVVDDNVDAADGLKMLLELDGEHVDAAYDGEAALRRARESRPQVVLLDVGMPGMDGYELARRLREAPETRDACIIAVTGWGQAEDRQKSKEAGFDLHLVKPIDPEALRRLLEGFRAKGTPRAPGP